MKFLLSTIIIQKGWSADQWMQVIFSDESSFSIFPIAGRVYAWRQPREDYNPDCLLPIEVDQ